MLSAADFSYVLSGGLDNRDHDLSLGGDASSQPVVGALDNLFSDITQAETDGGWVNYRCFYVFNDSKTDALFDARIFILDETSGGASVQLGFASSFARQAVNFDTTPTGGAAVFTYENQDVAAAWNGSVDNFATQVVQGLNALIGGDSVSYTLHGNGFIVTFGTNRWQPILVVKNNPTGAVISISGVQDGSPVNSTTVKIDSETTPPGGLTYYYPTYDDPFYLGDLYPSDGFPVWVKRSMDPGTTPLVLDGFTVRLTGFPAGVINPPPPLPIVTHEQVVMNGFIAVSGSAVITFNKFSAVMTGGVTTAGQAAIAFANPSIGGVVIGGSASTSNSIPQGPPTPCDICCYSGTLPELYVVSFTFVSSANSGVCDCIDFNQNQPGGVPFVMTFDPVACVWATTQVNSTPSTSAGIRQTSSLLLYYSQGSKTWRFTGGTAGCGGLHAEWASTDWKCCGVNTQATTLNGVILTGGCAPFQGNNVQISVAPGCLVDFGDGANYYPYDPNASIIYCQHPYPCNATAGTSCPEVVGGGVLVSGYANYVRTCQNCGTNFPPVSHPEWHAVGWEGFGGFPGDGGHIQANKGTVFPIFLGIYRSGQPSTALCNGSFDYVLDVANTTARAGDYDLLGSTDIGGGHLGIHFDFVCGSSQWNIGISIHPDAASGQVVLKFINLNGVSVSGPFPTMTVSF